MDKMRIFTPLIDGFQQKEGLAREDACANLVYLVNELLVPYFASQERFNEIHPCRAALLAEQPC